MSDMHQALEKAGAGERITRAEALILADSAGVHQLGQAALEVRTRLFGQQAFFVYNQHLNYTNICVNDCRFCAYSKRKGEEGSYVMMVEEVREAIKCRLHEPVEEVHVVGGLNPDLPYDYYLEMLAAIKEARPGVHIKAFTAVEIAFLAQKYKKTRKQVLTEFTQAGLDALPGGGAEVFSPHLRSKLCPEKLSGEEWLKVHELAHSLDIPTNCTLLFGHIETWQDRLDHLQALRDLQDRSGGFLCFIPLPYQTGGNDLQAEGPDGLDMVKMWAISRVFLDNIPHIKAYWVFCGIKAAQLGLWYGADDFDGTLVEEKVGHAAGADTPRGLGIEQLQHHIQAAGMIPVRRDSFFQPRT
ncbi:aminofutalosine synthase MqnE [Desulfonatronospira sp.]|uniref:aminofutalosine synthase MqnE n=1 Tax=Desulfonatronospira sp. TaxID=1962951 RepID=UPI0025BABB30|nr:aminofutalosine synthase MqnE [Desulfonatronospira sp.]